MGGSAKWKMHKIPSQRIRGSRVISQQGPWIQSGSGSGDPDLGQSDPRICNRGADLPVHMPGSASPSGGPICALKDSVTSAYSIARVDSLGGDQDG